MAAAEEVNIPKWLWGAAATLLMAVVGGIGTLVGNSLGDHDKRIEVNTVVLGKHEARLEEIGRRQQFIDDRLLRIEDKIDRLLGLTK